MVWIFPFTTALATRHKDYPRRTETFLALSCDDQSYWRWPDQRHVYRRIRPPGQLNSNSFAAVRTAETTTASLFGKDQPIDSVAGLCCILIKLFRQPPSSLHAFCTLLSNSQYRRRWTRPLSQLTYNTLLDTKLTMAPGILQEVRSPGQHPSEEQILRHSPSPNGEVSASLSRLQLPKASTPQCQVCVVGAGPAGLMLGCNLARFGIDVQVIDERDGKTTVGRYLLSCILLV